MKKKVLFFALVMVLVFSSIALPNSNIKADALTSEYFSYTVSRGYATITKYNGSATSVKVPSHIGGYKVTEIAEHAFSGNKNINTVSLPDAIVYIGAGAFYNCINLSDINIPINWSYTNIFDTYNGVPRSGIFENCTSLTKITIPEGKTFIPDAAFYNASYIQEVVLPTSLKSIGYRAFGNCFSLMKINLQDTKIEEISDMAFHWNYSLQNLTLPNTLVYIGEEAFCDCVSLLRIIIPANVRVIGDCAFAGCENLQYVTIPRSTTYIGGCAFEDCNNYLTIYGYVGSYAESYAKSNDIKFMAVDITENLFKYSIVNNSYARIDGCIDIVTDIFIPSNLGGYPVREIGKDAFNGNTNLISVSIPKSVTKISYGAFRNCINLRNVTIPDSVVSIGYYAFANCTALTDIVLPKQLTEICEGAFYKCENLKSIVIPDIVKFIGKFAFRDCTSLEEIAIPDGVQTINNLAFYDCKGLESIIIPNSVTTIGDYVFGGCSKLVVYGYAGSHAESYAIKNSIPFVKLDVFSYKIMSDENLGTYARINTYCGKYNKIVVPSNLGGYPVKEINAWAFRDSTELVTVKIPDGIKIIGALTFYNCYGLKNVIISKSVTSIGNDVFYGCKSLRKIEVDSANENYTSKDGVLFTKDLKTLICYPFDRKDSYGNTAYEYEVPFGVNAIEYDAFRECYSLKNVIISESVERIGNSAFSGCHNLDNITIPKSVNYIGKGAFCECYSLKYIMIPESVNYIGTETFKDCRNLTIYGYSNSYAEKYASENNIPFSAINDYLYNIITDNKLGKYVVITKYMGDDECITIPATLDGCPVKEIGEFAFENCSNIVNITIPSSVITIGDYAFYFCEGLKSINIPKGVQTIGDSAFCNCYSLEHITIPDDTNIGAGAFYGCVKLNSIIIPSCLKVIDDYTFYGCDKLEYVTIPESVTSIGESAFWACIGLKNITIPDSVKEISVSAFAGCKQLNIYGHSNSYAEEYANKMNIPFFAVND